MDNIYSIIFLKSGLPNIDDCYKILRNHKLSPRMIEHQNDYFHFTINNHTDEAVKVYVLTEYCYLIIKSDEQNIEPGEDTNDSVIDKLVKHTITEYIEIKQYILKQNLLKSLNKFVVSFDNE